VKQAPNQNQGFGQNNQNQATEQTFSWNSFQVNPNIITSWGQQPQIPVQPILKTDAPYFLLHS